jgi:outer membrane protein assembly factor BamD (BamD/ComL family)
MAESKNKEVEEIELEGGVVENSASEQFVENNAKKFGVIAGAIVALVVGVFFFYDMNSTSAQEDQKKIFAAQYYFSLDSLNLALFGDTTGAVVGFDDLRSDLESGKVKELNNFYIGVINMHNEDYETAVAYLKDFSTGSDLLQARAKALLGDAYLELAENDQANLSLAISSYEEASKIGETTAFTPGYLLKLALAYELNKDESNAISTYDKVISGYPSTTQEVQEAKKYKAVLEAKKNS